MKVGQTIYGVFKRSSEWEFEPAGEWEYHGHALTPVGAEAIRDEVKDKWDTRIDIVTIRSL